MTKRNQTLKRGGPFAAGVLIGLSVVTPVFAASLDVETLQPILLLGPLIVLLIGLIFEVHEGGAQNDDFHLQIPTFDAGRLQDVLAPTRMSLRVGFRIAQPLNAKLEQQLVFVE